MSEFRLVGVLHLPPLPGAMNYAGQPVGEIIDGAVADALVLQNAGFTDVMVQDANDRPQDVVLSAPGIAAMSAVGQAVRAAVDIGLGVVAGHNDGPGAMAVAHAVGADFVRVKVLTGAQIAPQGIISGCAVETARVRQQLRAEIEIWADVHEATSLPLGGSRVWAATEAVKFGAADRLVVTSDRGVEEAVEWIDEIRKGMPRAVPMIIGGRAHSGNMPAVRAGADGVIIGNAVKDGDGDDARVSLEKALALSGVSAAA